MSYLFNLWSTVTLSLVHVIESTYHQVCMRVSCQYDAKGVNAGMHKYAISSPPAMD